MQSKEFDKSLIDYLKEIPDEREANGTRHPQWLVLLLVIMAIMSGHWGYRDIGRFVERHRREFIKIFKISRAQVPSYSTIRRVMMAIDNEELALVFNQWASQYTHATSGQWVALDGKSLKNTVSDCHSREQNFVTMVSAFSHQRGEVLGLKVMENKKQSEINVVQQLLELLDLNKVVFTFDALHCQKKTLSTIIDSGNDYLVVVKRNQPSLHRQIDQYVWRTTPTRHFQQTQVTRDRLIHRTIEVFPPPDDIDSSWMGVNCVVKVFRHGTRGGKDYQSPEVVYYMGSLPPTSSVIPKGIQQHWGIENRLHWVKDVIYQEDPSPPLLGKASTNISILKSWVLNLMRVHGYDSMTEAISELSHNLSLLKSFCC